MAKIVGEVNGMRVDLDAPGFATEQSLQNLIKALTGKSTGPAQASAKASAKATDALNMAAESAFDFGDTMDLTSDQVEKSSGKLAKNFDKIGGKVIGFATEMGKGFERIASAGDEQSGRLSGTTDLMVDGLKTVTNALDDIVEGIPVIGGAISAFTTDVAQAGVEFGAFALSFVTGTLEGLREQQGKLFDSGVYFAKGIDDAAAIASDAGTTIGVLAKTASDASESLRLFEGGAANGMRSITQAFKLFGKTNQTVLYSLGFTQDEILAGIADYGASMAQAGRALSTQELSDGSLQYLVNLKELSRLTGVSIKEQRDSQEANRRNLFVQNQLAGLSAAERANTEKFLNTVPKEMQAFALAGRAFDADTGAIANRLPTYAAGIADITAQLKSGAINDVEAANRYRALMNDPRVAEEVRSNQQLLGQAPAELYGSLSGVVNTIGTLQAQLQGNIEAAREGAETIDIDAIKRQIEGAASGVEGAAGSLNVAIGQYTDIETKIANQMQAASLLMTNKALEFAGGLGGLLEQIMDRLAGDTPGSVQRLVEDMGGFFDLDANSESFESGSDPYAALTDAQLEAAGLRRSIQGGGQEYIDQFGMPQTTEGTVTYTRTTPQQQTPGRAVGGPVARGEDYIVGEAGPELFRPSTDGQIIPTGTAIPVRISGNNELSSMVNKLDSLISVNRAMLQAMEQSNNISRTSAMYAR